MELIKPADTRRVAIHFADNRLEEFNIAKNIVKTFVSELKKTYPESRHDGPRLIRITAAEPILDPRGIIVSWNKPRCLWVSEKFVERLMAGV